jgi:hypothetical protein
MLNKHFFESPALTLLLSFIVSISFSWGINWYIFDPKGLIFAVLIMLSIGFLIFAAASLAFSIFKKRITQVSKSVILLVGLLFSLFTIELFCFFLQPTLFAAVPDPRWKRILLTHIIPLTIFISIFYKFGLKPINIFLLIFFGISIVTTTYDIFIRDNIEQSDSSSKADNISNSDAEIFEFSNVIHFNDYKIDVKPNIYLFFLESYHSLDIQKDIFNIDTSSIDEYIKNNKFTNYGKIYSNSPETLLSMADTFLMSSAAHYARGNSDAQPFIRNLIGGNEYNVLFKLLKYNNYSTILITQSEYYGTQKGIYLDESDIFVSSGHNFYKDYIAKALYPISLLNSRLTFLNDKLKQFEKKFHGTLFTRVKQAFELGKQNKKPFFVYFKGGADHTPSTSSYTWKNRQAWLDSKAYEKNIHSGNQQLMKICDFILENDPQSIIILIGDHGAWLTRAAEGTAQNIAELYENLEKRGISAEMFCNDRFGVFLAVRLPNGETADISKGKAMSHVNLFRHIFAYLNQDDSILKMRVPSNSYFRNMVLVNERNIELKKTND